MLFESASDALWILDVDGDEPARCAAVNDAFVRLTGIPRDRIVGRSLEAWAPAASLDALRAWLRRVARTVEGSSLEDAADLGLGRLAGRLTATPVRGSGGGVDQILCIARDLTSQQAAEAHEAALAQEMALIAESAGLEEILIALVRHIELEDPASLCSVLMVDATGTRLLLAAAPNLPDFYNDAVHGLEIGPGVGSCGSAAFLGKRVVVEDVSSHPWWAAYREITARAGLGSCWSEPIVGGKGKVLGTFAVYHREPHSPSEADLMRLAVASRLAAIAIERERAEEAHRASEANFRGLFENAPVGIYRSSRDGRILSANPALAALLGYGSADEVLALRIAEDVYFDSAQREALIRDHEPEGSVKNLEITWRRKDGSPVELRIDSRVLKGDEGEIVGFEGFVTDVSLQKWNERSLRESEERYRDLVEHSLDLICTHDLDGRLLSFNASICQRLGYSRDELLTKSLPDLLVPETRDRFGAYIEELRRRGVARGLMLVESAAGERLIWEYNNTLRTAGVPIPIVRGMGRDVTEQMQARLMQDAMYKISESGQTAESLIELFGSIHRVLGKLLPARNFYVALYDEAADELTFPYFVDEFDPVPAPGPPRGLTGEVLRRGEALLITPETQHAVLGGAEPVVGTPSVDWLGVPLRSHGRVIGVLVVQSYSGETRYTDRHMALLQTISNQIAATIARKQAETALRASEIRYQQVVDNILDALIVDDVEGKVVFANDRFLDLFGLARTQVDGLELENYVTPEYRAQLRDRHDRRMRGEEVSELFEYEGLRGDGSRIWVEVRVSNVVVDGALVGTQSAIRDITEHKRAERERAQLEEALRQALKMEAVGSLAGGVAHDFNNMLAVILGNTEIALEEVEAGHPVRASLAQIRQATERSITLTRQLLTFARKQTIQPRVLDLNETVSQMVDMLERLIGENIELAWTPGEALWPVVLDPAQVDQILANLAVNARDAIDGSGRLEISTRNLTRNDFALEMGEEAGSGDYVELCVRDSGCGMDAATVERIFEPFFTTKGVGKGTGMGLATVYGIVRQNRGAIRVESARGQGTLLRIAFPRAEKAAETEPAAARVEKRAGRETILLVEDEEAVLQIGRNVLERAGYTVLAARTPDEAITIAESFGPPIHMLLTDVMLPGMSGKQLRERLEAYRPGLPCLFTSGYTADVIAHRGVLEKDVNFLGKPYSITALVAKVREVLDS